MMAAGRSVLGSSRLAGMQLNDDIKLENTDRSMDEFQILRQENEKNEVYRDNNDIS